MKRANSLFARAGAICTSLALSISLFPAAAFAEGEKPFNQTWNEQSRISVTAPVVILFGAEGNGHDKNSGNPTAVGIFKNYGDTPVSIDRVQYLPMQPESTTNNMLKDNQKMENVVSEITVNERKPLAIPQTVNAKTDADGKALTHKIILGPDTNTKVDYTLTIDESKVKDTAYDSGQKAWPIGKIKYLFGTEDLDFWMTDLTDPSNPATYSLSEVKSHAVDISNNGTNSQYYKPYFEFAKDPSKYKCGMMTETKSGKHTTPRELLIVGVAQDLKYASFKSGKYNASDYIASDFAGLTFQFKEILVMDRQANSVVYYPYVYPLHTDGLAYKKMHNATEDPYTTIVDVLGNNVLAVYKDDWDHKIPTAETLFYPDERSVVVEITNFMTDFPESVQVNRITGVIGNFKDEVTNSTIRYHYIYWYYHSSPEEHIRTYNGVNTPWACYGTMGSRGYMYQTCIDKSGYWRFMVANGTTGLSGPLLVQGTGDHWSLDLGIMPCFCL